MQFDTAQKALKTAEKQLSRTRQALDHARAQADSFGAVAAQAEADKRQAIVKASASGKLPDMVDLNGRIASAHQAHTEAVQLVTALESNEAEAVKALVQAEKAAQDALRDSWDAEADQIRDQLIAVAGPLLKSYWTARFHGHNPVAMFSLLRTPGGLLSDLDGSAQNAEAVFDNGIPEQVESALLSHEQRMQDVYHPALAV